VLAKPLTELLFGAAFAPAAPALPILVATLVPISLGYLDGQLVIAVGLQRRFVFFAIVALAFNVGANVILIPEYGFLAAAWITLATELIVIGLTMTTVFSRLGWAPRVKGLARVLAAATVLALAVWGLEAAGTPLIATLVLAGPIYIGLLLAVRGVEPREIRAVLRKGGAYAAMHRQISHASPSGPRAGGPVSVSIKLFNLVARELGPGFLAQGVLIGGADLQDYFRRQDRGFGKIGRAADIDGRPVDFEKIPDIIPENGLVLLALRSADPHPE